MLGLNDPARAEIVKRALAAGISDNPDRQGHPLGRITLADGNTANAFIMHAADAVITDGVHLVMIRRRHEPGAGMLALPGGMLDMPGGMVETTLQAAIREAMEEVNMDLSGARWRASGARRFNRPFDVRVVEDKPYAKALAEYGIYPRDIFLVSTQAIRFDMPELASLSLKAGDDAKTAELMRIDALVPQQIGVPDHYEMIRNALSL